MNEVNIKWIKISQSLKRLFNINMVKPDTNESSIATLVVGKVTVGILEDMEPGIRDTVKITMRTCLTPHDAARIAVGIGTQYVLMFGPHFEINEAGELLYGDEALEFAFGENPLIIGNAVFDEVSLKPQYINPN